MKDTFEENRFWDIPPKGHCCPTDCGNVLELVETFLVENHLHNKESSDDLIFHAGDLHRRLTKELKPLDYVMELSVILIFEFIKFLLCALFQSPKRPSNGPRNAKLETATRDFYTMLIQNIDASMDSLHVSTLLAQDKNLYSIDWSLVGKITGMEKNILHHHTGSVVVATAMFNIRQGRCNLQHELVVQFPPVVPCHGSGMLKVIRGGKEGRLLKS
jgi:hypothetical protein